MAGFIWDTRWPRSDSVTSWVSGSCYADDSVKITSHRGRTERESDAAEGSQNVFTPLRTCTGPTYERSLRRINTKSHLIAHKWLEQEGMQGYTSNDCANLPVP
jgi:hypothetical protein